MVMIGSYAEFQARVKEIYYDSGKPEEISYEWRTGGARGRSCWDEGSHQNYPVSGDPEPQPGEIMRVAMEFAPNLSYAQVMRIMSATSTRDRTVNEYYGNYTEYAVRAIGTRELYDLLVAFEDEAGSAMRTIAKEYDHKLAVGQRIIYDSRYDDDEIPGRVASLGDYTDRVVVQFDSGTTISVESRWCRPA
jgi:hypothetical protein